MWRLLPYLLAALGAFLSFLGLTGVVSPGPEAPVEMTLEELEKTDASDLPAWIKVDEGYAYWYDSTTIYNEDQSGNIQSYDELLAPYLSQGTLMGWEANLSPEKVTAFVIRYPWRQLKADYPLIATLATGEDAGVEVGQADLRAEMPMTFTFHGAARESGGPEETVIQELKAKGFKNVVWVKPGSSPLGKGGAIGLLLIGLVILVLAVLWIMSRWRTKTPPPHPLHRPPPSSPPPIPQ